MDNINFQVASKGFGSYLTGILPDDIAIAAGAFSATMQQIKNIRNVDFEKFSQVAFSIETTKGLNLVNGSNIPTNLSLAQQTHSLTALGSGPNGSYTMSDFFGSMSGLPYMWSPIYNGIVELQTTTLTSIYQDLYLAVDWEPATATWDGATFTYTNRGGGYGRNGASAPTVTVGGNPAVAVIGTDTNDLTTYGTLVEIQYTGPAGAVVIDIPPDDGTGGWPGMNTVVQSLIDDANNEISNILTLNPIKANNLNAVYNNTGSQLTIEQRARYTGIQPVPTVTRDTKLNSYPTSLFVFVDAISNMGQNTLPHMSAQTLEAISDLSTTGGQSIVALLRSARNQAKLQAIGVPLDDNISGTIDSEAEKALLANGVVPLGDPGFNGYTVPSLQQQSLNAEIVSPIPLGYYNGNEYITTSGTMKGNPVVDVNNPCCCVVVVGTNIPTGNEKVLDTGQPKVLGSLAGALPILPVNLNTAYTSSTLLPVTYSVSEAIDEVIRCNCDCWVN